MAKMGVAYAPLAARDYVLREMAACPEVRPLVLVLKQLVHRNGLNNPYTGGIASHTRIHDNGTVDLDLADSHDTESAMAAVLGLAPMRSVALRRMNLDDVFVEIVGAADGEQKKGARIDA